MKFSPCGWFCFDEPDQWSALDTEQSIELKHTLLKASIEVTSARKHIPVRESEIWEMLEKDENLKSFEPFEETSMYRLPGGMECLRSIHGNQHQLHGRAFVFWSHYCIQLKLEASAPPPQLQQALQSFDQLLESIQSLTTD